VQTFIRYSQVLRLQPPSVEGHQLSHLPQFYADMFGWREKAQAVAEVYNRLPEADKKKCAIYAENYGRCAAIDFFGSPAGLPKSIGGHNSYWIWGPREYTGEVMIILAHDLGDKREHFEQVEVVGKVSAEYCMPYENNLTVYLCRNLRMPLREVWPRVKSYI